MRYEKPVWQMVKEAVEALKGKAKYAEIKEYIKLNYGDVNESTINCTIIVCTVNVPSRIHYPENNKPRQADSNYDFLYSIGPGHVESYHSNKHGNWEIIRNENDGKLSIHKIDEHIKPDEKDETYLFALESHLRDFMAQNIHTLKVGDSPLQLYVDEAGNGGVEFRTDVGFIDILAIDEEHNFVVFELKVNRGIDQALGQLLRYMGWVKSNIGSSGEVKGVIVAQAIDEKLKYAVSVVKNVSLYEYEMNFKIDAVQLS